MEKIELTDIQKQMIEDALLKNEYCDIGILDEKRFFCGQRNSLPEFLVLINSSVFYGEVWGHIFWHDNSWVSCLAQITGWFSGESADQLIEDYWENILERGGFTCLSPDAGDSFVVISDSLDRAVDELITLIAKLHPNAFSDDAEANIDLYEVYGFAPLIVGSLYAK
jgi:hypothetical protein